jgi:hypothetical protein
VTSRIGPRDSRFGGEFVRYFSEWPAPTNIVIRDCSFFLQTVAHGDGPAIARSIGRPETGSHFGRDIPSRAQVFLDLTIERSGHPPQFSLGDLLRFRDEYYSYSIHLNPCNASEATNGAGRTMYPKASGEVSGFRSRASRRSDRQARFPVPKVST